MSQVSAGHPVEQMTSSGAIVRGFVHEPAVVPAASLVLTHGAGSNANAPLLITLANAFAAKGIAVLRYDLPFRQARPKGPPHPSNAKSDQEGLRAAVEALRSLVPGRIFLGGQSYGGRQATMLAASDSALCDGLLLLSYPLHPPGNASKPRTSHFPELRIPALFVQGSSDPFGSVEEMKAALQLIPAPHRHLVIEGVGHDLKRGRRSEGEPFNLEHAVVNAFQDFFLHARS